MSRAFELLLAHLQVLSWPVRLMLQPSCLICLLVALAFRLRVLDTSCEYCNQLICFLAQLRQAFCVHDFRFHEQLKPVFRFVEFLQTDFQLADELGIGSTSRCFTVMRANRRSRSEHLLSDHLRCRRGWQCRVNPNNSQCELLRARSQILPWSVQFLPHPSSFQLTRSILASRIRSASQDVNSSFSICCRVTGSSAAG